MSPYKTAAQISPDHHLTLTDLPFEAGAMVEVTLRPVKLLPRSEKRYPLRGLPIRFEEPFEPVALDDWSALK